MSRHSCALPSQSVASVKMEENNLRFAEGNADCRSICRSIDRGTERELVSRQSTRKKMTHNSVKPHSVPTEMRNWAKATAINHRK